MNSIIEEIILNLLYVELLKRWKSYLNERKTVYNSTEINRGCGIFRRDRSKRDVILYISQSVPNHIGRRGFGWDVVLVVRVLGLQQHVKLYCSRRHRGYADVWLQRLALTAAQTLLVLFQHCLNFIFHFACYCRPAKPHQFY